MSLSHDLKKKGNTDSGNDPGRVDGGNGNAWTFLAGMDQAAFASWPTELGSFDGWFALYIATPGGDVDGSLLGKAGGQGRS